MVRPTTADDRPAKHRVILAATGDVFGRHAFEPPRPVLEGFAAIQGHLIETGTSVVCEEGGEVAAYCSAYARGGDWFLASLFVAPAMQGRGVGPALLDAVWGEAPRRRTITDSHQPVSNVLYGRRGLVATTPILTFEGRPEGCSSDAEAASGDLADIDAAAYGFDRSVDHAYWGQVTRRTTWGDAYSYAAPWGDIGPVGGLTPAAAARALEAELARAEGPVKLRVPGSARALVEVALEARLRLSPAHGLLLLSDGLRPPDALAISGFALY